MRDKNIGCLPVIIKISPLVWLPLTISVRLRQIIGSAIAGYTIGVQNRLLFISPIGRCEANMKAHFMYTWHQKISTTFYSAVLGEAPTLDMYLA